MMRWMQCVVLGPMVGFGAGAAAQNCATRVVVIRNCATYTRIDADNTLLVGSVA